MKIPITRTPGVIRVSVALEVTPKSFLCHASKYLPNFLAIFVTCIVLAQKKRPIDFFRSAPAKNHVRLAHIQHIKKASKTMRNWEYNEVLLALYAYCHVPFNKANNANPWIVKIARAINRSPAAVKMKIGNLGAFDPELKSRGVVGLSKTSHIDERVWNDYANNWDKLAYDAEKLLSCHGEGLIDDLKNLPIGSEKYIIAKRRINQQFFRDAVITSYDSRCCISGITEPALLEAAHIISWSDNEAERTNPQNGLCLNPFFHKAYDNFLLTITADFKIILSEKLLFSAKEHRMYQYLVGLQFRDISLPNRFLPSKNNLAIHHEKYVSRN